MSPEDARRELTEKHKFDPTTLDVWLQAEGRCEYCGADLLSTPGLYFHGAHIDHIVPGGGEDLHNKALSCVVCNIIKRSYKPNGADRKARVEDAKKYIRGLRDDRDAGRLAEALLLLADCGLERARTIQLTL